MAPRQASQSQERRASSRAKRRAAKSEPPPEQLEENGRSEAAEALWEAASAAIVGAAVGAAKALAQQREAERGEAVPEESFDEPEAEVADEPEPEPEPEPEEESEPAAESEPELEPEPEGEPGRPGDAPQMVRRAREHLLELRGAQAESVSTVARTAHGWRVGLEVVEVRRIPESTDVLATYEVQLDADGELVTFERTHRYYRSEADRR